MDLTGKSIGGDTASLSKDDIVAILKATRELGPEYDDHTAEQLLSLIRQSSLPSSGMDGLDIWQRLSERDRRRLARRYLKNYGSLPLRQIIPVLALSIPLMWIAGEVAQTPGVMAVLALDFLAILIAALNH